MSYVFNPFTGTLQLGSSGVPYTGATANVDLGQKNLAAAGLNITGGTPVTIGTVQHIPFPTVVYDPAGTLIAAGQFYYVYVVGYQTVSGTLLYESLNYTTGCLADNSGRNFYVQIDWSQVVVGRQYEVIISTAGSSGIFTNNAPGFDALFPALGVTTANYGDGTAWNVNGAQVLPNAVYPGNVNLNAQSIGTFGNTGTYLGDAVNIYLDAPVVNLTQKPTPTAPNDGDIWQDGTNIKMQIGGVTKTFTLV